jgi:hypothetical protein
VKALGGAELDYNKAAENVYKFKKLSFLLSGSILDRVLV